MKIYDTAGIRNVAIVGHGGSGKTSLTSAMLFDAGAVNRLGKVEDGNTVTDFDADEIARQISLSTSLAHCEWNKTKLNLLDTPGYGNFIQEARLALRVADTMLVNICGVGGVEVQAEKVWQFADEFGPARMIVINRLDRDRSSFSRSFESVTEAFGREAVPVQLPVGEESNFKGVVDLVRMRAYIYEDGEKGSFKEQDVPAEMKDEVEAAHGTLVEMVAEGDDALMEKYFDQGELSAEELLSGLKQAILAGNVYPVFACAGARNIAVQPLMNALVELGPAPDARGETNALDADGNEITRKISSEEPVSALIFKTIADPFAGRISLFRVMSGILKPDSSYQNTTSESAERLGGLALLQGKDSVPVDEIRAGDLGSVAKLKDSHTGDTLADKSAPITFKKVVFPEPVISFAIEPKSRGDEEKINQALQRMGEEDNMLRFRRDGELILSGTGQLHIEVVVARLKEKFGVEVDLHPPKVPYRETIKGTAEAHARHKKQTGGHGQFADCHVRFEPLESGADFQFGNEVFGGSIPRQFIPAVEKGIQQARLKGFLAGYPMVDFKATVFDGKYHAVDSSEMAFKIAGSMAFKEAMQKCKPTLLEPIMDVEITVPEESTGDVMGDLNSRRGRTQGMDTKGNATSIKAQVPMAEMLNYEPALTSMTGGRGAFHMEFSHYEEVPAHQIQKIVAERKAELEAKA
ncbi:MAG: elongation factor G [Acidobacteria bacterium]|nr:MAG: elongation factor G [Acidobacteriota bacterium]